MLAQVSVGGSLPVQDASSSAPASRLERDELVHVVCVVTLDTSQLVDVPAQKAHCNSHK
jgi:hypothetical protein